MRNPAAGSARERSALARGAPSLRSRLVALGMLLAVLAMAALSAWAFSEERRADAKVARHSVEAAKDSGAGRHVCAKPPDRSGGPEDHGPEDRLRNPKDREHATGRRILDHHQVDVAQPDGCGIVPPREVVLAALPSAEKRDEHEPYRTFDGRAPPRTMS